MFFKEFKEFALKGNVMDMAIGVIIGGAFQKIVTSLVNDIIMPAISIVTGKVDFSKLSIQISEDSYLTYGNFITTIIDFLIIALSIFIAIKIINKLNSKTIEGAKKLSNTKLGKKLKKNKKEQPIPKEQTPTIKVCPFCFSEINIQASRCPHCTSELEKINK